MKLTPAIIRLASAFIEQKCNHLDDGGIIFRKAVLLANRCDLLSVEADLEKSGRMVAHVAALFLYLPSTTVSGEQELSSKDQASSFLSSYDADPEIIAAVLECMDAVQLPFTAMTSSAQVLCDAVNSLMVEQGGSITGALPVFAEEGRKWTDTEKMALVSYLENIRFYLQPARKLYDKPRQKYLVQFGQQLRSDALQSQAISPIIDSTSGRTTNAPELERGAETLFRITSRRHSEIANLAHQKSAFLVSINAIILSIILSVLSTKLSTHSYLLIPVVLTIVSCVSTITVAILATIPMMVGHPKGPFDNERQNILFFGHYAHMNWDEYRARLVTTTNQSNSLFDALARDIYYQGLVLQKKYRLLSLAYRIFMGGLILSCLGFLFSFLK